MGKLLGYMLTWTTYGTWLQGDKRKYVKDGKTLDPDPELQKANERLLKNPKVKLIRAQREKISASILAEAERLGQKVFALAGMPYAVLMPVFAKDVLHGGSSTFGFLMAASGIGALTAALYMAARKTVLGLGKLLVAATIIFGLSIIIFSFSNVLWLSMAIMFFAGFGMMVNLASCNTILQTMVDDDKRGRVMSIFAMAFMGMVPFGSLIAGALAHRIGAPNTLLIGGSCCIAAGVAFARKLPVLRKMVRPIYIKKGIITEAGSAVQTAAELNIPPER